MAGRQRLSGVATAALAGALLFSSGVGVAALDAQARVHAAEASLAASQATIEESSGDDFISFDISSMREWFIFDNLRSGGPMPTLTIVEDEDGSIAYVGWGPTNGGIRPGSLGGWQFSTVTLLPAAGLLVLIGSAFVAAGRWRPGHPFSEAIPGEDRTSN